MDDEHNTTGSSTYHIDKLTEMNYRSWVQQLHWILDERDLWELVEGKEKRPVAPVQCSQFFIRLFDYSRITESNNR